MILSAVGMTMEDIRKYEKEMQQKTNEKVGKSEDTPKEGQANDSSTPDDLDADSTPV